MKINLFVISGTLLFTIFNYSNNVLGQSINDQENYFGDKIAMSVNATLTERDAANVQVCLPKGKSLRVIGQDTKNLYVRVEKANVTNCDPHADAEHKKLSNAIAYQIPTDDFKKNGGTRQGFTYGALVVPFKYQLKGDHDLTGSASIGAYLGYRFQWLSNIATTLTPILFLGASNVSVKDQNDTDINNLMGVSYGFGLVSTFKGSFQAGMVYGWDRVGGNSDYEYNNKPWLALEIGFAFLQ